MGMLEEAGQPVHGQPVPNETELPGHQPVDKDRLESLKSDAVKFIYSDKLPELMDMFETRGPENFPQAMATAVNGALSAIGDMSHEEAAYVGMEIYMMILEDVISSEVVPGVTMEQVDQAIPATIKMYADAHGDITEQDMAAFMQELDKKSQGGQNPAQSEVAQDGIA